MEYKKAVAHMDSTSRTSSEKLMAESGSGIPGRDLSHGDHSIFGFLAHFFLQANHTAQDQPDDDLWRAEAKTNNNKLSKTRNTRVYSD